MSSRDRPILYFDFVDPASRLVSEFADQAGIATMIDWRGLELRPPPSPMINPADPEWRTRCARVDAQAKKMERRRGRHGLPGPGEPQVVPWTRKAHELCEFARERDCFDAIRRSLFRAHFDDHTDIGRIDLLVEIARQAGLDRSETRAVLDVDRYTAAVLQNRDTARRMGVADVPALVSSGRRLVGPEVLCEIERAIGKLDGSTAGTDKDE